MMTLIAWLRIRNVQLALGAVLVGALSFLLARRLLHGQELMAEQRFAMRYAMRDVVVAARELKAGESLEPVSLARRAVPERFLAGDAYPASSAGQLLGLRLLRALRGGEPVTASAVEPAAAAPLSARVGAGMRALTIPVDESAAAGGLLSPGDLIDVLVVTHPEAMGSEGPRVVPLLQAVPVMATGQRMANAAAAVVDGVPADAAASFSTVTLLLHPDEAERILLAQGQGELAFLVRTPGDDQPIDLEALDSGSLVRRAGARVHALGGRGGAIEFIIGGVGEATRLPRAFAALAQGGTP